MSIEPTVPPAPSLAQPRVLEVAHIARCLSFCEDHVRRLLRKKIPAARVSGRRWVDPVDVEAFIDAHRVPAVDQHG